MWTRKELKDYAKGFLRQYYWEAFLVVLITTILTSGFGSAGQSQLPTQDDFDFNGNTQENFTIDMGLPSKVFNFTSGIIKSPLGFITVGVVGTFALVLSILFMTVGFILEVGQSRFFLDGFKGDVNIKKVFSGFNSQEYLAIFKAQFLKLVSIFLWSLLLVVPGIIKTYQYRYVAYILAQDSSVSPREALDRSKAMTMGHKMDIFILDFSFILWNLVNLVTFGIGGIFVNPYVEATNARLYRILSQNPESY